MNATDQQTRREKAAQTSRERGARLFLPKERGGEGWKIEPGSEEPGHFALFPPEEEVLKTGKARIDVHLWPEPRCEYEKDDYLFGCDAWTYYGFCSHISGTQQYVFHCCAIARHAQKPRYDSTPAGLPRSASTADVEANRAITADRHRDYD